MASDQSDIGRVTFQRLLQPEMVALVLRGDHDEGFRPDGSFGEIEVLSDEPLSLRKGTAVGGGVVDCDGKAHQISQCGKRLSNPAVAHNEKVWLRQNRFDKDIHSPSAGHA